jgi:hypothetical protein
VHLLVELHIAGGVFSDIVKFSAKTEDCTIVGELIVKYHMRRS